MPVCERVWVAVGSRWRHAVVCGEVLLLLGIGSVMLPLLLDLPEPSIRGLKRLGLRS